MHDNYAWKCYVHRFAWKGNAAAWKTSGWACIADCSNMEPVTPAESTELVAMTKAFVEAGCKAFAFAEGHFATVDEALNWLKNVVHI